MPIARYGVLIGRPLHGVPGRGTNAHYQVHVVDRTTEYRIAVNVKSQLAPSEVEYLVDDDFRHPITEMFRHHEPGFYLLGSMPAERRPRLSSAATCSIARACGRCRSNCPGPTTTSTTRSIASSRPAIAEEDAFVCAFGQRWGPEDAVRDKIFGFLPGNGIHDIHMNQGNSGQFVNDDGVWQDGGLLVLLPVGRSMDGVFLKFQSQSWHTDDVHGHTIPTPVPVPECRRAGPAPDPAGTVVRASRICGFDHRGAGQPARQRPGRRDGDAAERHRHRSAA
jgi:uncharacterized protein YukJ